MAIARHINHSGKTEKTYARAQGYRTHRVTGAANARILNSLSSVLLPFIPLSCLSIFVVATPFVPLSMFFGMTTAFEGRLDQRFVPARVSTSVMYRLDGTIPATHFAPLVPSLSSSAGVATAETSDETSLVIRSTGPYN